MSLSQPSLPFDDTPPLKRGTVSPCETRTRRNKRSMAVAAETTSDRELLEQVLCCVMPRGDVQPLARALLERFGGFGAVVAAEPQRLQQVPGVASAMVTQIKLIEAAAVRLARSRVEDRQVLSSWQTLLDYCQTSLAHKATEHFRVFFLNRQNQLIADEEHGTGSVDHVPVYPREVIRRALDLNATALILVHNHPSGDPSPSEDDIAMTGRISDAAAVMGIVLHDHVIIGQNGSFSFRAEGLLGG